MLFWSIVRFWGNGWIDLLYIRPRYFFPFYGFDFVVPLANYTYWLFAICSISAILVAIGLFYRLAAISLFLSFTYIELIDKTTYLNHYYFISMICLLLIFLPAHAYFSLDSYRNKRLLADSMPQWCLDVIKLFVCLLYFYAGLAKINSDWLLHALPLKIWLPARNEMPIIGFLFNYSWIHYTFSWFGCLYDLSIPFLLWNKRTRIVAYFAVVIFHLLTSLLFPIGMFPYIMIVTALIFFSSEFHQSIINTLAKLSRVSQEFLHPAKKYVFQNRTQSFLLTGFAIFFVAQLAIPFRYLLYPGELFWTEEGYRFSWRVMLMEKAGMAEFTVKDEMGSHLVVNNDLFLTNLQAKMMATQPDMLLQYAHILRDYYAKHGFQSPQVYVDSYVTLNGRLGQPMINPKTDLAKEKESFQAKPWILPFNDEIKGF
jgi:hypothetical protein